MGGPPMSTYLVYLGIKLWHIKVRGAPGESLGSELVNYTKPCQPKLYPNKEMKTVDSLSMY